MTWAAVSAVTAAGVAAPGDDAGDPGGALAGAADGLPQSTARTAVISKAGMGIFIRGSARAMVLGN